LDNGGGFRSQEETDQFWSEAESEEIEEASAAIVAVANYANQRCR